LIEGSDDRHERRHGRRLDAPLTAIPGLVEDSLEIVENQQDRPPLSDESTRAVKQCPERIVEPRGIAAWAARIHLVSEVVAEAGHRGHARECLTIAFNTAPASHR
jgi:hypothetical protein